MAESNITPLDEGTGAYLYSRTRFTEAGQDSYTEPPAQDPDMFAVFRNVMPVTTGVISQRWGYSLLSIAAPRESQRMYEYYNDSTSSRRIIFSTIYTSLYTLALNQDGTHYFNLFVPTSGATPPRVAVSRNFAYFVDGKLEDRWKWDGGTSVTFPYSLTNWGITGPTAAPTIGKQGVPGAVTLAVGRSYVICYKNSTTGDVSSPSPLSASSGPVSMDRINVTNIPVSTDNQVDKKLVLATADGNDPNTLYFLAEIPNSQTACEDNTSEPDLLLANVYQETDADGRDHGVYNNDRPPTGDIVVSHKGRLYIADGQTLYFSKSLDEVTTSTGVIIGRHEDYWPADYKLDISAGVETIKALFSDGTGLYIGTEFHVRRLLGDGPENFTAAEIVFSNAGIASQEAWQIVFREGAPAGVFWYTLDGRIIGSDFNTAANIGAPVQNVLNELPIARRSQVQTMRVSWNAFDLFIVGLPIANSIYMNEWLVFDVKNRKWGVWRPPHAPSAFLFNIASTGEVRPLFTAGAMVYYLGNDTKDYTTAITSTLTTNWLDLGDPYLRKHLNELSVITADSAMTVTIQGASTRAEFTTPVAVVTDAPLVASPFGDYKVRLAGKTTKDRFYRFTFTTTSQAAPIILGAWSVEVVPIHRL